MKNQEETLKEIWGQGYMNTLPAWVKERGYCYAKNTVQKDLLITGINPSYTGDATYEFDFQHVNTRQPHWRNIRKMVCAEGVDLRPCAAYLDIFYFRNTKQQDIKKALIPCAGWPEFAVAQLRLTQRTIEEVIKPKLIVVANKESYAYWGKLDKYVWMGYDFKLLEETPYGDLCKIEGLQPNNISSLPATQLKGTKVLFGKHSSTGAEYPPAAFLQTLLK
jgi:hypothetical protein